MRVIKLISPLLVGVAILQVEAQNIMTSSPYSMFGLGEISTGLHGQNAGMGSVTHGMRDLNLINTDNPAGLSGLDSMKLFAETSAFIKGENYYSSGNSNNAFTGNLSSFVLAGRMMPNWYVAAGLSPYTSVGYYLRASQPLEGTANSIYYSLFYGDGGLSKVYLTNSFRLPYNLAFGFNLSYLFGNLTQTEEQETMIVQQKLYTQTFYADFGLQYEKALSRFSKLVLGAVYGYQQKLTLDNTLTVSSTSASNEYDNKKVTQYLPQFVGVGGSLSYKRWNYALDYTFHGYSVWKSGDSRIKFKDTHEWKAGISFRPGGQSYESYFKRMVYKGGVNFSNPYYTINGKNGMSWRVTGGMAFPVMNGQLNAAFFYDRMKLSGNVLEKNIVGLTVTYTLGERFYRAKL